MKQDNRPEHPQSAIGAEVIRFLEIAGLSAFAIAQPLFDVLGRSPETFIFHGAAPLDIIVFAVILIAVPPIILWAAGAATRVLGERVREATHVATVFSLAAVVAFQVLKRVTEAPGRVLLPAGLLLGAAGAWLLTRDQVRGWLRFTSLAVVPFTLFFLLLSPVSELVLPAPADPATPQAQPKKQPPIVMVIFDQFPVRSLVDPSGDVDGRRHPNFARLAEESTWYRNFTAAAMHTQYALPALMTGRKPELGKGTGFRNHPNNLYTLLADSYDFRAFEIFSALCPRTVCIPPTPDAIERSFEPATLSGLVRESTWTWWDISAPYRIERDIRAQFTEKAEFLEPAFLDDRDEVAAQVRVSGKWAAFLASLKPSQEPTFYFVHMTVPHYPWRYFPSGRTYDHDPIPRVEVDAVDQGQRPILWPDEQWPIQLQRQRHLLQIQYVDRLLGTLLRHLEENDLYDRSLVIVTSDHGLSAGAGGGAADEKLHEMIWAPLFVKEPGQTQGAVDDVNIWAIDLLPTIADHLGVEIPWEIHGISALDPSADRGHMKVYRNPESKEGATYSVSLETAWDRIRDGAFRPAIDEVDDSMLLYRFGPRAELIGERLDPSAVGAVSSATAKLDKPRAMDDVDLASGEVPALVTGFVSGTDDGSLVAVVVNGRIAAVVPTYRLGDRQGRFSALVPEFLFEQGRNDMLLYLLESSTFRPIEKG